MPPDFGAAVHVALAPWPHVGAAATLSGWHWRDHAAPSDRDAGGRARLGALAVAVCTSTDPKLLRWALCVGPEGGVLQSEGTGALDARREHLQAWWAAQAELILPLFTGSGWRLPLRLSFVAPLKNARYSIDAGGSARELVFETQPALRLGLGVALP